jgi:hypothetical protein
MWRWGIWCFLLWRLSRLKIKPLPSHPDRQGGLGFLAEPSQGLAYVLMALSTVQAGVWANQIVFGEVAVATLKAQLGVIVASGLVIALGPLLFFSGHLWRGRFQFIRQHDELATDYHRSFHERWVVRHEREGLLGSADIQSLADLGNAYEVVDRMRLFPLSLRLVMVLAGAMLAPMVPLVLLQIPLLEILKKLSAVALGGLPG